MAGDSNQNWSGNLTYSAAALHRPETIDQLRNLIIQKPKLKTLGTRHSFNTVADTTGEQISLERFDQIIGIDAAHRTVKVQAGVRYGTLGQYLHQHGYALRNLASLPHISIAGACSTATHGSGDKNGNLATAVVAMDLMTANGELITISRDNSGHEFDGMVVGLGAFGVITNLTLEIVPSFSIRQHVYEFLLFKQLEENFENIMSSAYSVSLFTDWQTDSVNQVWLKQRVENDSPANPSATFFGAKPAPADRHPIVSISAINCTAQMGVAGPWHERLPHFRMDYTPSSGEELQSEYFVPRKNAVEALKSVAKLRQSLAPVLMISEVRTIAKDSLWMSPCNQCDCVGIHFTWKRNWPEVRKVLPMIEERLSPLEARPHWGKLFTITSDRIESLYEKLPSFRQLANQYDPTGKFRNEFLDTYIFAGN